MSLAVQNITRAQRILVKAGYVSATTASLAMVVGALLAPWLVSRNPEPALHLYRFYAHICHQNPSHSFALFGHPAAACARCLGIYAGFLAGCLAFPFFRNLFQSRIPRPWTFVLMSFPLAADVLANFLRLWDLGNWFRLATGVIWGFILPFYWLAGLADLILRKLAFRRPST
jgi:uncharacterized membrane protein